ncbi:unnamed protein product [Anisakis simplex]|uniref:Chromosome partition protein Smc n=1 Tax=Anisakis simplex TaxID=6269 RepID=A0A0M3J9W9_ANISI|nr:unnamed protein product [Anisakis simplex]
MQYKEQINALITEHESIVNQLKKDFERVSSERDQLSEKLEASIKTNAKKLAEFESRLKDVSGELNNERKQSQNTIMKQGEELSKLRCEQETSKKTVDALNAKLKEKENALSELMKEQWIDNDQITTLNEQLTHLQNTFVFRAILFVETS